MNVLEIQIRSIEMQFAFATWYVLIVNLNARTTARTCVTHSHIHTHLLRHIDSSSSTQYAMICAIGKMRCAQANKHEFIAEI